MTPSLQDDEIKTKMRTLFKDGKSMYEIAEILEIPKGTIDSAFYRNTHNIRDFFNELKKERFLMLAERFSDSLMTTDEMEDARMYAIKQKEAEFLRETLGKDNYSKKTEVDNTQPITINVKSYNENIKSLDTPVSDSRVSLPPPQTDVQEKEHDVKTLTK